MADKETPSWRKFQKMRFNSTGISKRAKRVETATVRHARKFIFQRLDSVRSVRRHILGWMLLVGVLIGAVGLQLMWFQRSYMTTASVAGGTYAEGVLGPVETLNPLYATTSAERSAAKLLFSSLYSYDTTGTLKSSLASGMTTNEKGTEYTVALRSDARWQDGTKMTADDIVFTINLIKNPATRSVIGGWDNISVRAISDDKVLFTLPAPYAAFPHALTFPILPKHILESVSPSTLRENNFSQSPVGSGPFKLRLLQNIDAASGRKVIHLVANSSYFEGTPKLERLQLHVYPSREAITTALRTGEVNAAADLSSDLVAKVNQQAYTVTSRPIDNGVYALLNTNNEILKDKSVRKALQLATDTQKLRADLPGDVRALDLPFIQGQLTGKDVPAAPKPDLVAAAKLLDEAGWKQASSGTVRMKDGKPLRLSVVSLKGSDFEKTLKVLSEQWRQLGIMVDGRVLDPDDSSQNVLQTVLQPRSFDILLYEFSIGEDPDVYAYWHSSQSSQRGLNFSNYSNSAADDALTSARSRSEPELRNAKYIGFAKQWLADVPAIGLYQSNAYYVTGKGIQAFDKNNKFVSPIDRYNDVLYWTVQSGTVYKTP